MTVVLPAGNTSPELNLLVNVNTPQLSEAVGACQIPTDELFAGLAIKNKFAGQPTMFGFMLSVRHGSVVVTVTLNVQLLTFLLTSVAV